MGLIRRAASLASVPVTTGARLAGAATATAFGADRDAVYARATAASVETLTAALAKARGPALKFGQALAVFSSALPPEQAAQLTALTRLYEDAKPQPLKTIEKQLSALPPGVEVDPEAIAAASLGQVHRATWSDGTPVAIKVQYADAPKVVRSDMMQLRAMAPLVGRLLPTLDVKALIDEHAARLAEELNYTHEAHWQERFRTAWADEGIVVPRVVFSTGTVLVTEWIGGTPFTALTDAPAHRRDAAGRQLARFCFWSPRLVGATHADPHPGNFRLLDDDRLAVLDFGSVADDSGLFTHLFSQTLVLASEGRDDEVLSAWREAGLVADSTTTPQLIEMLDPDVRPYTREEFTFSREWLQTRSQQFQDPVQALQGASRLRFPPDYLLEHRAVMGTIALMCGLDATVDFRHVIDGVGGDVAQLA
jgi:predicted unusual protein kinase regulating ubiquinone biosynthesis (AarF/ABC1/UbiB family)